MDAQALLGQEVMQQILVRRGKQVAQDQPALLVRQEWDKQVPQYFGEQQAMLVLRDARALLDLLAAVVLLEMWGSLET